jgi:hypothetical protein
MHKPLQALAAAILLALTLDSSNIFAADVKTYPGAMCQRHQNNDLNGLDYISGTAVNVSASNFSVECPIVKDVLNTPISRGRIAVLARNPNEPVTCVIRSIEATNGADFPSNQITQTVRTTVTGLGVQYLAFDSLTDFGNDSYYSMTCILPPIFQINDAPRGSAIVFYQLRGE